MSNGVLYYCKISVKEGLGIDQKPHLERFIDKTFSRKCRKIAKNIKEDENTCNS